MTPPLPRLAATVLLMAKAPANTFKVGNPSFKLLFIQRSRGSGFMASAHVFPGGVLDEADRHAAAEWEKDLNGASTKPSLFSFPIRQHTSNGNDGCVPGGGDSIALRLCAIRELYEEAGVLLARPRSRPTQTTAFTGAEACTNIPRVTSVPPVEASHPRPPRPSLYSSAHRFESIEEQRRIQASISGHAHPSLGSSSSTTASSSSLAATTAPNGKQATARRPRGGGGGFVALNSFLSSRDLELDPLRLAPWSRWVTPNFESKRFDTMFYVASLPRPFHPLNPCPFEVSEAVWLSPSEALRLASEERIVLPPPTTYILKEMEALSCMEEVWTNVPHRSLRPLLPVLLPPDCVPQHCPIPKASDSAAAASASSSGAHSTSTTQALPSLPTAAGAADTTTATSQIHIALPKDPCYDFAFAVSSSNSPSSSSSSTSPSLPSDAFDQSRWHRMVRSLSTSDGKKSAQTTIYRPAHLCQFMMTHAKNGRSRLPKEVLEANEQEERRVKDAIEPQVANDNLLDQQDTANFKNSSSSIPHQSHPRRAKL